MTRLFRPASASIFLALSLAATGLGTAAEVPDPATMPEIQAYCLDYNWQGKDRKSKIADPGFMNRADPAAVVEWHKTIGCNVIQTFCVSHNGYAWYRNEVTPEQPGLEHDFLREVVKLGHAEGMVVMGYFSIAANIRWGTENPELSYGLGGYHLPYTDEYLAYLDAAIRDAVGTTGIDGFMIDWVWQPSRGKEGKWIEAEKKLYQQLMDEPFPGEDKLTPQQYLAYSRKAIDRCWKTIRKAAKETNPKCIVWLTCNDMRSPHVVDSDMFREVDWLMAETGNNAQLEAVRNAVGKHTRLITCLANWNKASPSKVIPEAKANGIGLYGYCRPRNKIGTIPLEKILSEPLTMFNGDDRNISALARAYHGKSLDAVWNGETFVEPEIPPALDLHIPVRRRGYTDVGRVVMDGAATAAVETFSHYHHGEASLTKRTPAWPDTRLRLWARENMPAEVATLHITNGKLACEIPLEEGAAIRWGTTDNLLLGKEWSFTAIESSGPKPQQAQIRKTPELLEIVVPAAFFEGNPEAIAYEWLK